VNPIETLKAISKGEIPVPPVASDLKIWKHEQGTPLIGQIQGFSEFEHELYGRSDTILVKRETGETVSAILSEYLKKGIEFQHGQIGDHILLEKQGQDRHNGKIVNRFQLVVMKSTGADIQDEPEGSQLDSYTFTMA
jgi:hypothetical protein